MNFDEGSKREGILDFRPGKDNYLIIDRNGGPCNQADDTRDLTFKIVIRAVRCPCEVGSERLLDFTRDPNPTGVDRVMDFRQRADRNRVFYFCARDLNSQTI